MRCLIATVTLNPAVDRNITVAGFEVGKTNRGCTARLHPGGKGINVAMAARRLGCHVIASGLLAGNNGRFILEALRAMDILTDFVETEGETRVNLKINDPESGVETEINEPGFQVNAAALRQLEARVDDLAKQCAVMVFSGSLPPGAPPDVYAAFLGIAKDRGAWTILDTSGDALHSGLQAGPAMVKPNLNEAEELLGRALHEDAELASAAREMQTMGAGSAVISMGREGALGVFDAGVPQPGAHTPGPPAPAAPPPSTASQCLRAYPIPVTRVSSTGAGDCMVAAFAHALVNGLSWTEAMRLSVAVSSLAAGGTESLFDMRDVPVMLPQVTVTELKDQVESGGAPSGGFGARPAHADARRPRRAGHAQKVSEPK